MNRMVQPPALTVVIATYQRRRLVMTALDALARQDAADPLEVVVVVDGSTDGTGQAVRDEQWPFALQILEQPNRGPAAARNRGVEAARGEIVLFLDDDMEADPALVRAHIDAHRTGAEVVVGAMPLHPDSPRNILSEDVGRWADQLAERCSRPGYRLGPDDVFGGHLSIGRDLFHRLGGFDQRFTSGGRFGNEDIDLAHRIFALGCRVVFRPDAISYQRFEITAAEDLRRWEEVGSADMALARLHPDLHPSLRAASLRQPPRTVLARAAVAAPNLVAALAAPARWLAVALVDRGTRDPLTKRLFARLHALAYWLGVARSGGPLDSKNVRVLCWHALADLAADPLLQAYGVPPRKFREQLDTLRRAGWAALSADEFLALLEDGATVPRRAFLVTFDDCYTDLASVGHPVLAEAGVAAAAFVVTEYVGKESSWDPAVMPLPLADWSAVETLQREGWEIGAHSQTHPMLTTLEDAALWLEVAGSREELVKQGMPPPRLFAYPYGDWDARVRSVAERAGYRAAFTVDPGTARPGVDPFAIPRIEVLPEDVGRRLRRKLRLGGRVPVLWLTGSRRRRDVLAIARRMLRPVLGPAVRPFRERLRRRELERRDG